MKSRGFIQGLSFISFFLFHAVHIQAVEPEEKSDYFFYLDQAFEYDNNVITNVDKAQTQEADSVYQTDIWLNLNLTPKHARDFEIKLYYEFLQYLYDEFTEFDYQYHAPGGTFSWFASSEQKVYLEGGYVYTEQDSHELYKGPWAGLGIKHFFSEKSSVFAGYEISEEDYAPDLEGYDALKHYVEVKYKRAWFPDKLEWAFSAYAYLNDAENNGFSYYSLGGEAYLHLYEWPGKFNWDFTFDYSFSEYDDIYPGFFDERHDHFITVVGKVSYPIYGDNVFVSAKVQYINGFSNLELFDYDQVIVGGHVTVSI